MTLGKREFSKEAKSAIFVMRSLIISEKGASSLFRILGDFRKEEGHPLMYKDFGYRSAVEFLEATGEFILREQNGEVMIFVKPSEGSSHIQKMIAAQKSTKPRVAAKKPAYAMTWNKTPYQTNRYLDGQNNFKSYQQQPQYSSYQQQSKPHYSHHQQNPAKPFGSYQQQTKPVTTFSLQQQSKPVSSYQHQQQQSTPVSSYQQQQQQSTPVSSYQQQQQQSKPVSSYQHQQQQSKPVSSYQQQQQSKPVSSYQQQQRFKDPNNPLSSFFENKAETGTQRQSTVPTQQAPTPKVAPTSETEPARPSRSTNPFLQSSTNPFVKIDQPVMKHPAQVDAPIKTESTSQSTPQIMSTPQIGDGQKMDTTENKPIVRVFHQNFNAPVSQVCTPNSIAQVVQTQQQTLIEALTSKNQSNEKALQSPKKPSPAPFKWDQPDAKPEDLLFEYGQSYGSIPIYKFFQVKNRVLCKVTINGTVYRTYPHDFATELEGKTAVARIAIDAIRRNETRTYRVCDDTDADIASKIYDLLLPCQYGMQLDNIPNAFRDAHGSLLPQHWKLIVQANLTRLFKSEVIPKHNLIVFAVLREEQLSPHALQMSTNLIELPWSEQYWDLFVTHPVSPDEIWARLVGAEYSDRMGDLMTNIEQWMERGNKQTPEKVTVGEYYLVELQNNWHRVRVESHDRTANAWQCFFIDLGGAIPVPLDLIHVCEPRFLELPGQAICFTLEGLQGFSDNPSVEAYLEDSVSGKVLIGEVHTTKQQYEAKDDDLAGYGDVPIKITLFDTSTEENVNINDILKSIRNAQSKP